MCESSRKMKQSRFALIVVVFIDPVGLQLPRVIPMFSAIFFYYDSASKTISTVMQTEFQYREYGYHSSVNSNHLRAVTFIINAHYVRRPNNNAIDRDPRKSRCYRRENFPCLLHYTSAVDAEEVLMTYHIQLLCARAVSVQCRLFLFG